MAKLKSFVSTGCIVEELKKVEGEITTTEQKVNEDVVLPETTEAPEPTKTNKKVAKKAKVSKKVSKKVEKKVTPKPNVVYSRDEKTHKDEMSKILSAEFPTWKTELLSQAKALSVAIVGTDIYNFKGELLESFTEAVIEGMNAPSEDL